MLVSNFSTCLWNITTYVHYNVFFILYYKKFFFSQNFIVCVC